MKNHKSASSHFSPEFLGSTGYGQVAQAFSLCGFSFSAVRDGAQTEVCATCSCSISRRIYRNNLAAGERDFHGPQTPHPIDDGESLFLRMPINRDRLPRLKCVVSPPNAPGHNVRRVKFHSPRFDGALVALHVEKKQRMRILPIEFLHQPADGSPLVRVPTRRPVMREYRP